MTTPRRILHLVHQYRPEFVGGTELYTHWLATAQREAGQMVGVVYRRPGEAGLQRREEAGVRVWAISAGEMSPMRRFGATFHQPALLKAFSEVLDIFAPQIVHLQHLMGWPLAVVDLLQAKNIPFVITLHDFWWVCANAQLITNYDQTLCAGPNALHLNCARCAVARTEQAWLRPAEPLLAPPLAWRNRRLRQILGQASQLIAPTDFVRQWYLAHGAPAESIRTLSHAVPLPQPLPPAEPSPHQPLRLAYIGGLSWQKGVHIAVEAMQSISGAELWLAGDETADPAYVARLRGLAGPSVRFLGRLSRAEVWQTLAQIDVLLVPALWYETFSLIISEAFAMGVPVIASRLGPLADRVRSEVDGLLLEPGQVSVWQKALQSLADDPTPLSRWQANIQPPLSLSEHQVRVNALYPR